MIKYRQIFLFTAILTLLFLSGCEKELDLDKYRSSEVDNMLVVNSILNPDSLIAVSVTHPYFFSEPHLHFEPVKSLDVKVAGASGAWETLDYDEDSELYLGRRTPMAGEMLRLRINGEAQTVVSCDTVPSKVNIEGVEVTGEGPMHIYWGRDYRFTYKITFQDTPDEENFYFLVVDDDRLYYEITEMGEIDYTADYVFQVLASIINQDIQGWQPEEVAFGYPFCDRGIDGERYTITVHEIIQTPLTSLVERLPRAVKLYSISRSYFEYMVSVLSMDYEENAIKGNLLSLGLMEPTKIYSNIEGGTGIMGSYNLSVAKVDLLQLTGGWPTKE